MTKKRRERGTGGIFQRADKMWVGFVTLPSSDGKQHRKYVYSKDHATVVRKQRELRQAVLADARNKGREAMKTVTLNQLHENTSDVIQELYSSQEPFVLTRHGRLLALVTPLPDGTEDQLVSEWLKEHPEVFRPVLRLIGSQSIGGQASPQLREQDADLVD